jgi:DNA-binding beta-propeller fold protein YncE
VFDANDLGAAAGGQRLTKITLFADTPRALAATPDGKTVYAASFFSGNQTTTVTDEAVLQVYGGTMPGPATITLGGTTLPQPGTGEVVKYKAGPDGTFHWFDMYGSNFDAFVNITLPDDDVFAIDATANPPAASSASPFQHVGTTLFNMAVNPKSGKVYVSNTDAHNDVRFEGHTPGFSSVVGNTVDSRISVLDPSTSKVTATDNLNSHLDHTTGMGDPSLSLAFPEGIEVTADGRQLYVIAQGSSKLAVYDTKAIEAGPVAPTAASQVLLSGGGPTGLALDEENGVAFVLTRFDNGISVVDLHGRKERQHIALYDPEPESVTAGRRDLYDATRTSALGDQACASCHIGGDFDGLAWDLGVPGNTPLPITTTYANETDLHTIPEAAIAATIGAQAAAYEFAAYQPLKGPMTTQSLRGLDNHGAMHWRGDRNGAIQQNGAPFLDGSGNPVITAQPNSGMFDEFNAFKSFNVAFPSLLGNATQLSDAEMGAFATFALQMTYPPNPIRSLDDTMTAEQQAGHDFYFNKLSDGSEAPSDSAHNCNGCHTLDRTGNAGVSPHPGFFGTDGRLSFEAETQLFKVPHLRNAYQKLGMYASSPAPNRDVASAIPQLNGQPASGAPVPAVRGFGYLHDGSVGTIEEFLTAIVFLQVNGQITLPSGGTLGPNPAGIPLFNNPANPFDSSGGISTQGLQLRQALSSFVLSYDSNLFPIVGQQVTLTARDTSSAAARIALFEAQSAAGNCDVIVRGQIGGRERGFVLSKGSFVQDRSRAPALSDNALRALVGTLTPSLTFTCVPPGSGWRLGIDRDGDGYADGDELAAGSDPANANSIP